MMTAQSTAALASAPAPKTKASKRKIYRDMSKCILCGRCRNACPTKSIRFTLENRGLCTHCNLCAEVCPVKAIDSFETKIKPEDYGKKYFLTSTYKERVIKFNCVKCMQCYERCPTGAIYLDNGELKIRRGDAGASIINCSLCTLCCLACPTAALKFELGRVKLNADLCVLCGECVRVCPPQTIYLKDRYPGGYCVLCGRCVRSCPVGALSIKTQSWEGEIE
jgi:ferredoxin